MAGCGDQGCNCAVQGGAGIVVSGAGTARSPYRVELESGLGGTFGVEDTPSVNLTLVGAGVPGNPYRLSATSTMRLTQLADVLDPQGGPNIGDVPVWVGGAEPHWEFQPPPANPAGAVNVGAGMAGNGTIGDPLKPKLVSATAGPTSGLAVYVDTAGNLRATTPTATAVDWDEIDNKPTAFETTPEKFTGTLPVLKGGTGVTDLANLTVGNALRIDGRTIYTTSATPTGTIPLNSLWLY